MPDAGVTAQRTAEHRLRDVHVEKFRNLVEADLRLGSRWTIIAGDNGAGKSALLEAIYCLSRGEGFRPGNVTQLVRHGEANFLVRGVIASDDTVVGRLAVVRGRSGLRLRVNGEDERSIATFARHLPVLVITTEGQRLLTDGPGGRRALVNWGVFHVEHRFAGLWQQYRRVLRQRNLALRRGDRRTVRAWAPSLTDLGQQVREHHEAYLERLLPYWEAIAADFLPTMRLEWRYHPGWRRDETLAESLTRQSDQEERLGYTLAGPHRADFRLRAEGHDAQYVLSRGQQKLAVIALKLAQLELQGGEGPQRPLVLVDDLVAELDVRHRGAVLDRLAAMNIQAVLTAIDPMTLPARVAGDSSDARMFHVEQGNVTEVVQYPG
ncbi:DNA replication/repair protein RecF [Arhodomonas sp. KWT2]|uniref:DNA replication/repair protein RecF n=1 Tax=unclassified Arhodomonas TaxID=2621637 RepID=UPI0013D23D28|nr:DNA replication/repair protein RecF [Arhodomonas sp. KWT]